MLGLLMSVSIIKTGACHCYILIRKKGIKVKVYAFKDDQQGIIEIENSLEAEQAFVGGLIDVYALTDDLDIVLNDEGLINGLEPRAVVLGEVTVEAKKQRKIKEIIHGDCFVCRHDDEGNFLSIREEGIKTIQHFVKAVISINSGVIIIQE